jgi:ornithine decarboxylase
VIRDPLGPDALDGLRLPSPFLALDLDAVERAYGALRRALPQVGVHYAVKCNPEPALLARLHALGAGFEVASLAELRMLAALGVHAGGVLYSNPVKPPAHIAGAAALGLDRFAVDSRCELEKLVADAPGTRVYVRLDASDPTSRVPLAGKFGVDPATAIELLLDARDVGLVPHGLTFHVGSQALDPAAYEQAIELSGAVMRAAPAAVECASSCSISAVAFPRATPRRSRRSSRSALRSPARSHASRTRSRSWPSPAARWSQGRGCSRRP